MIRTRAARHFSMHFHFLSLSTGQPHPKAAVNPIEWPTALARKKISLSFQICDDGFYVLSQRNQREGTDQLCGWQWTTGRLAVVSQSSLDKCDADARPFEHLEQCLLRASSF
jgi:hypothetical protein